jgi:hypothetical protein
MNWLEIDRTIVNMMGIYTDRDKLFADVKQRFSWNDSQVIAAVEPLLKRWGWYNKKLEVIPPTTKKTSATKKKPAAKKATAKTKTKAKPKGKKT